MPNLDIRSDLEVQFVMNAGISTDTTTNGEIIDTAHYDGGIMIAFIVYAYVVGDYTILLEESDDSGMAGATAITDDQLIGTEATMSAVTALGANGTTIGFFSTKRYVRPSIVSLNTSSPNGADIFAVAVKKGEVLPVV